MVRSSTRPIRSCVKILALLRKHPENAEFYNYVKQIRRGEAGLGEQVQRGGRRCTARSHPREESLTRYESWIVSYAKLTRQIPAGSQTAIAGAVPGLDAAKVDRRERGRKSGSENVWSDWLARFKELIKQAIKVESTETLQGQKGRTRSEHPW